MKALKVTLVCVMSLVLTVTAFADDKADERRVSDALATIWGELLSANYKDSPEAKKAYFDGISRAIKFDGSNPRDRGLQEGLKFHEAIENMKKLGLPLKEDVLIDALREIVIEGKKPAKTSEEAKADLELFLASKTLPKSLDKEKENEWVKQQASLKNARLTAGGVVVVPIQEGTGASPTDDDTAQITYTGFLSDGNVFDSTEDQPFDIPLNSVIKGFAEGLKEMKEGGTYIIFIPPHLAYGETGAGSGTIPPNAALQFNIKLLNIKK